MSTKMPTWMALVLAVGLGPSGCSLFELDGDDGNDDSETSSAEPTSSTTGEGEDPWPPEEGFRVRPLYMLQLLSATVSVEIDGEVQTCAPDTEGEGYLCDTSDAPGPTVPITVEREGFETAVRNPDLASGLEPLDVHMTIEGGPEGVWGGCLPAGAALDCSEACASEALACLPTACSTEDPEQPLASAQLFADPECLGPEAELAVDDCDSPLPDAASFRCCCEP